MTTPSHPHTPAMGHVHTRTCPQAVEQLVDYLERELADIQHIMLTDVDLSTGDLILWLDNGRRFVVTIAESAERAD